MGDNRKYQNLNRSHIIGASSGIVKMTATPASSVPITPDSRDMLGRTVVAYGTIERPLFLAADVAEWLEHSDTEVMLRTVDEDEKIKVKTPPVNCTGGLQANTEYWFLTEDGLYEVLMLSRKLVAKEFRKLVPEVKAAV
jgi:hypothetical protein